MRQQSAAAGQLARVLASLAHVLAVVLAMQPVAPPLSYLGTTIRRCPIFPGSLPPSIFSAKELNFCVRDGYRCVLFAIITGFFFSFEG